MDPTPFKLDIDDLFSLQKDLTTLADMKTVWEAKKFSYIYEGQPNSGSAFFMQSLFSYAMGVELGLDALMKMSAEYAKAKQSAVKEVAGTMDLEDIKHIADNTNLLENIVDEIVGEWDAQKEDFYKQNGFRCPNELVAVDDFDELDDCWKNGGMPS